MDRIARMALTPAFLDELRARTSLSALVGKSVKLQKAGREHRGCCPFHNEKTPSFYVNDDKGFYHCFGCSAHGDAIRWMTDSQGLPFIDAVKELALSAGMEVPAPDKRSAEKAERAKDLHDAMQAAADFFAGQLGGLDGGEARALIARRKLGDKARRDFGLGFAPDSRGKLRTALKEFGDAMLVETGLLIQVDGKEPYDRFRSRLMIPIRDPRGRVIAFGGRIIGDGEPKYLNSPDTPLFDKGRTLYNLDRAAPPARKAGRLFVVEGYMDAIALAQAGIDEVVAPLGTALTEHQLERLWRVVDVPTLCFDGDAAGQKAALRAAHRALPLMQPGRSLRFVTMPEGKDPDDLVREKGAAGFEAAVDGGCDLVRFLWDAERRSFDVAGPDGRTALKQKLLDAVGTIPHPILRGEYAREINDLFFEHFGWKKKKGWSKDDVATVRGAMQEAREQGRGQVEAAVWRSVLLGLARYPAVLRDEVETLLRLRPPTEHLQRWLNVLTDAVFEHEQLDRPLIETILAGTDMPSIDPWAVCGDLGFSFCRRETDEPKAVADLSQVITVLGWEQEMARSLEEASARLAIEMDETNWTAQQELMLAKNMLDQQYQETMEQAREAA
jgi:DNA primase